MNAVAANINNQSHLREDGETSPAAFPSDRLRDLSPDPGVVLLRLPFILLFNLLGLVRYGLSVGLYTIGSLFRGRQRTFVRLEPSGGLPLGRPGGVGRFVKSDATFFEIRKDIKTLAADPSVAGVVIDTSNVQLGPARAADLAYEVAHLRDSSKQVIAYAPMFTTRGYLDATSADAIVMPPAGRFFTLAPRFEQMFFGDAIRKHGGRAQFVHVGLFKGAAAQWVRSAHEPAQRAMLQQLRTGLESLMVSRVAERRQMPGEQARALFGESPLEPRSAKAHGLIDGEVYQRDLARWIDAPQGHIHLPEGEREATNVVLATTQEYYASRPAPYRWKPLLKRPRAFAVLELTGLIMPSGVKIPGGAATIDPDRVGAAVERIIAQRRIAGVLVHINSPGGSAPASDEIWGILAHLRSRMPMVAYCSDIAASGGYYMAVAADRIVCRPQSIIGSIGVAAGKIAVGGVLERFGVTIEAVDGADGSELGSALTPLEPQTFAHLHADSRAYYRRFLQRVGQARDIDRRRLHRYARGRIYLGEQSLQRGLVDEIGGLHTALAALRQLCAKDNVELPEDPPLRYFPTHAVSMRQLVMSGASAVTGVDMTGVASAAAVVELAKREQVLALTPWVLRTH